MRTGRLIQIAIDAAIKETLTDLRERLVKADRELTRLQRLNPARDAAEQREAGRLAGKREGVRLALSYVDEALRTAQPAEEAAR